MSWSTPGTCLILTGIILVAICLCAAWWPRDDNDWDDGSQF